MKFNNSKSNYAIANNAKTNQPKANKVKTYPLKSLCKDLLIYVTALLLITIMSLKSALANNTSGVHGPVIKSGERSMMLRTTFVPGEDGADDKFAYRLHYQQAMSDTLRWRVITQFRDRDEFELDYLRAEMLWYLTPERTDNWDSALRFDIRARKGSRAEKFAINWTNQWVVGKWQFRGIIIPGWDFSGDAKGGTKLETRGSALYKLDSGQKLGIEMFNNFGKLSDVGSWSEQKHQLGPVISGKIAGVKYQLGYLAGVSAAADDHDIRLWFSKSF